MPEIIDDIITTENDITDDLMSNTKFISHKLHETSITKYKKIPNI